MRQRPAVISRVARVWAVAIMAFAAFVFGTSERAAACSCVLFTDQEALENADAAFTGTLVEIITPPGDTYSSTDPERFVFDVHHVFKGDVFARQSVVTARDGGSCGLELSGSGPSVVFARTESDGITGGAVDGELYSNRCSGTRVLADRSLPASFGEASSPVPGMSAIGDKESQRSRTWAAAIGGTFAVLGAGCALAVHRRKRAARSGKL